MKKAIILLNQDNRDRDAVFLTLPSPRCSNGVPEFRGSAPILHFPLAQPHFLSQYGTMPADAPPIRIDHAPGDATGLVMPAHAQALLADGAAWLTRAFRAFGSMGTDNSVARIVSAEPCPGGSTGAKLFLTVEYAWPDPALYSQLFVKFSRDFSDARRDIAKREMASEARFESIARLPGFPIAVPAPYFADYHADSGTGLIITQRIFYGEGGIELHRRKCFDHDMPDPLPYYRATITALARLAAAHKAGHLAPDISTRFPLDPNFSGNDLIQSSAAELGDQLAYCRRFGEDAPQLLPPEVREPEFLAQLQRDAMRIHRNEAAIQRFLLGDPDLVALCHWNAHIDNCWFWRDGAGVMQCGLIDWGRAGQITFGSALWGALSAAHHDVWDNHLDELLALFLSEYHAGGGELILLDRLKAHLTLSIAHMGVARVFAFPENVLFRVPDALAASGPLDPAILASDPARNQMHIYTVFLKFWRRAGVGACLDAVLGPAGEDHCKLV